MWKWGTCTDWETSESEGLACRWDSVAKKSNKRHRNALKLPWSVQVFVAARYKVHKHELRTGSARILHDHTISVVGVANS